MPVVASQSTLPEEAWSKWIGFLLSGVGWDRVGTLDDLLILCQKSRLQICPQKNVFGNKQSATDGPYQAASKLVSSESTTLEVGRLGDGFDR